MNLNHAIRLARKSLAGEEIESQEAKDAYDVLAKHHLLISTAQDAFQTINPTTIKSLKESQNALRTK